MRFTSENQRVAFRELIQYVNWHDIGLILARPDILVHIEQRFPNVKLRPTEAYIDTLLRKFRAVGYLRTTKPGRYVIEQHIPEDLSTTKLDEMYTLSLRKG